MSKIFITGSTDGIGFLAAKQLLKEGHEVYFHARNEKRAKDVKQKLEKEVKVLVADLSDINQIRRLARELNEFGPYDAIIHNAGVISVPSEIMFTVNVIAPYLLTTLVEKPERLVYLSSSMHRSGNTFKGNLNIQNVNYSDSKLYITTLMSAFARQYPDMYINAVDPGWVPTKMGGSGAPDDLQKGYETQVWLATSQDREALVSGKYFYHKKQQNTNSIVDNIAFQERLIEACEAFIKE
ncbi:SDR family NAD(P)-dependent oxidoreductase [Mangrovimonas cancribranchiae]|uniref:SDR family NAD(P)-dependent oxidoreductase n=1 Tax=Mangrovimonas cancribranchiae TaxID=3080055 RepID=A0AAU6NXW7_9FLAO